MASKIILFSLSLFMVIVLLGFSTTSFYYDVLQTYDPFSRIMLHFFPLVPLFIVLTMADLKVGKRI